MLVSRIDTTMESSKWSNLLEKANIILHGWSVNNKNFVLDPLTCMIRLAMLSHLPEGTKISIQQNRVTYNNASIFQGPVRWVSGDTRDDLHNLHNPLQKITLWYHTDTDAFQFLLKKAIVGLQKVKHTYPEQSIITHTLDHYIGILESSLVEDTSKINDLDKEIMRQEPISIKKHTDDRDNRQEKSVTPTSKEEDDITRETNIRENLLYQSFKKLWNYRQLVTIYYLYQELEKVDDNQVNASGYIQAIENLLDVKETTVTQFITRVTTVL